MEPLIDEEPDQDGRDHEGQGQVGPLIEEVLAAGDSASVRSGNSAANKDVAKLEVNDCS